MLRPVVPSIDYLIRYDYIVTELCENRDRPEMECNGACYLMKSVKQATAQDSEPDTPLPPAPVEEFPVAVRQLFALFAPLGDHGPRGPSVDDFVSRLFEKGEYHPPETRG